MKDFIVQCMAIIAKEFRSEFRLRYNTHGVLLFSVTAVALILFSIEGREITPAMHSGLLWIIIFFSGMAQMSQSFVGEEERGTALTLKLLVPSLPVFVGKWIFNCIILLFLSVGITLLYSFFYTEFIIRLKFMYVLVLLMGVVGFATTATFMSAMIIKTKAKGTLYTVLSFPVLLPLFISVIDATAGAIEGSGRNIEENILVLIGYIIAMIAASVLLFNVLWKDNYE